MTIQEEKFLTVYRYAVKDKLQGNSDDLQKLKILSDAEWRSIFNIAEEQDVFAAVFEAAWPLLQNTGFSKERKDAWLDKAAELTCEQAQSEAEFLRLYQFLSSRKLSPVLLDGIVSKELYEIPEHFSSYDIKLLISPEQIDEYKNAFESYGLYPAASVYEAAETMSFSNAKVHITILTNPVSEFHFNIDACCRKKLMISGISVECLNDTDQLLYNLLNVCSRFKSGQVRIRMISDIILHSLNHIEDIEWELIKNKANEAEQSDLIRSIYQFGIQWIFSEQESEKLSQIWNLDKLFNSSEYQYIADIIFSSHNLKKHSVNISSKNETDEVNHSRKIYSWIKQSFLSSVLKLSFSVISSFEYLFMNLIWYLKGCRMPDHEERMLVNKNVTFIFKSFERQHLAKNLVRNLTRFYPGAAVIIADDSKQPLKIELPNVKVIQMPYNSGLCAGLYKALAEVKTPYVFRMDDDELLTLKSGIHRELKYLMNHPEIDLIGLGYTNAIRLQNPKDIIHEYYKTSMDEAILPLKIPHMTKIDESHTVLGKVANIYLVRTESVRKVGYDPNIRIIDHHDFFFRAAGVITSAAAEDTVVFHSHNPFRKSYNKYRSDYSKDLEYISRKRNIVKRRI